MIRYTLACASGHAFESWFRDSAAFELESRRGHLSCPVCGTAEVGKALMAPAVALRQAAEPARQEFAMPGARDHAMREMLRAFRRHVEANAENVGGSFPEEARKIHYGEAEARAIFGEASLEEAQALHDEGIEVMSMPPEPDALN